MKIKVVALLLMTMFIAAAMQQYCRADNEIVALEIPQEQLQPMQQLLDAYCQDASSGVKYSIYRGKKPMFVLVGDSERIDLLYTMLTKLGEQKLYKDLIYITASLEEAQISKSVDVGLNIGDVPVEVNLTAGNGSVPGGSAGVQWDVTIGDGSTALLVGKLKAGSGDSNILVAGQLTTTNGIRGELVSTDQIPYPTVNANGSVDVQYEDATTSLKVTPVIIEYDADNPQNSYVKLDIDMQVSSILGKSTTAGTLPQVSDRMLATTRVVRADNQGYIVATMLRDQDAKTNVGIPWLRQLPLVKYLFSNDVNADERVVAYLKIAVRFVRQTDAVSESYIKDIRPSGVNGGVNAQSR